jgi:hypothetical protein
MLAPNVTFGPLTSATHANSASQWRGPINRNKPMSGYVALTQIPLLCDVTASAVHSNVVYVNEMVGSPGILNQNLKLWKLLVNLIQTSSLI